MVYKVDVELIGKGNINIKNELPAIIFESEQTYRKIYDETDVKLGQGSYGICMKTKNKKSGLF